MSYFAYSEDIIHDQAYFVGRDEAAGILGTIKPSSDPVAVADDLEALEIKALAYLCQKPGGLLYLTDPNGRVYRTLYNVKYAEAVANGDKKSGMCPALLLFCVTAFIGSMFNGPAAWWVVGGFVVASLLYIISVLSGFFNELEGAIMPEIILILALILVPAFAKAHHKTMNAQPPSAAISPTALLFNNA